MTYGEAWAVVTMSDRIDTLLPAHEPQMSKVNTLKYYSAKFHDYWDDYFMDEISDDRQRINTIRAMATSSVKYRRFCFKKQFCPI